MKLKIAVNKNCLNKQSQPARDWLNIYEDLDWLLGWVAAGYGWTATHFRDRHRKAENASAEPAERQSTRARGADADSGVR